MHRVFPRFSVAICTLSFATVPSARAASSGETMKPTSAAQALVRKRLLVALTSSTADAPRDALPQASAAPKLAVLEFKNQFDPSEASTDISRYLADQVRSRFQGTAALAVGDHQGEY